MVERLSVGSDAPFFTLFDEHNHRLDEHTLKTDHLILLYFYPQSTSVQVLEQFYHTNSSLLMNTHVWAVLIEDSDDPLLINNDLKIIEDEMKDNVYPFDVLIDRDGQVAWNYNVYNRDTKQGQQGLFLLACSRHSNEEKMIPRIVHMQIVDESQGKTTIDWQEVENQIRNLIEMNTN